MSVQVAHVTVTGRPDRLTCRVQNGDQVKWDLERAKRGWPAMSDAYNLWGAFVVHSALIRAGQDVPVDFDAFVDVLEQLEFGDVEEVDPTLPGLAPGG